MDTTFGRRQIQKQEKEDAGWSLSDFLSLSLRFYDVELLGIRHICKTDITTARKCIVS